MKTPVFNPENEILQLENSFQTIKEWNYVNPTQTSSVKEEKSIAILFYEVQHYLDVKTGKTIDQCPSWT